MTPNHANSKSGVLGMPAFSEIILSGRGVRDSEQ